MRSIILEHLKTIEEEYNVKIIFAAESGSRAWGFPSYDSDYDVRFIYIHPKSEYLKINKGRDVIEYILTDELDINGWDLFKALGLLQASNPTLLEWINSPIVYYETLFFNNIKEISKQYFSIKKEANHYLSMANSNYLRNIKGKDILNFKKYFYVLRPILAAGWVLEKKCIPPLSFLILVEDILPNELREKVYILLQMKKESSEKRQITKILELNNYIEKSICKYSSIVSSIENDINGYDELNELFLMGLEYFYGKDEETTSSRHSIKCSD